MGQLTTNYDTSKTFIGDNRYENGTYTNPDGVEVTLAKGTVMGRVAATNKLLPLESGASDGSQFPVGVLADDYTVDAYDDATVSICVGGDVAAEKIVFANGTDTTATVVSSRTLGDRIAGDTLGIKLVSGTELTGYDNQ